MLMASPTVLCINGKKHIYSDVKYVFLYLFTLFPFFMFALIIVTCNMFFYLLDRLFEMCVRVFFPLDLFATYIHTLYIFVDGTCHNHKRVLLLNCLIEYLQCRKHCKNAGKQT